MSRIRYPGSKHKLRKLILRQFPSDFIGGLFGTNGMTYVEPFFGSGAVGWEVLAGLREGTRVVINDIDYWVMCLWKTVKEQPEELIAKIKAAQLAASLFEEYKQQDGDRHVEPCEAGFRKLLLQQMSYSGLGAMAGGPIGGKDQSNDKYNVESRWNVVEQIEHVRIRHLLLAKYDAEIHAQDFAGLIKQTDSPKTLFYLDPPYVIKGAELYKYPFTEADHIRLSELAKAMRGQFVLSYDDTPSVRDLYKDFRIVEVNAMYSITGARKNSELIIRNF